MKFVHPYQAMVLGTSLFTLLATGAFTSWAQEPLRVFADLDQSGQPAVQLPAEPGTESRFAIISPLPESLAGTDDGSANDKVAAVAERLGRVRIEAAPSSTLTLTARGCEPGCLMLFQKTAGGWSLVKPTGPATWQLNANGEGVVEAGIGVRLPDVTADTELSAWPGRFSLGIAATADKGCEVPFRVAPFLIPGPLDPVSEILIVSSEDTTAAVADLRKLADASGINLTVHEAPPPADQWMQDTIEPGVFVVPSQPEPAQSQAALSGVRSGFGEWASALDRQVTTLLDQRGVVTLAPGLPRENTRWIDWFGNLEVTPAHTAADGRQFPYGRLLTGQQEKLGMHPSVMKFLEAQAIQWPPIVVDTSWLVIGHVDEVVNFVPCSSSRGYKVLLPSPAAARKLLETLVSEGQAGLPVFADSRGATTVGKLLEKVAGSEENLAADRTIESIRQQLAKELQLEDNDFVLLPVLFEQGGAVIPNAVNSVVANGHFIAPGPRGPRLDGKDLFEESIRQALKDCAVQVHFVDAWQAYHVMGGEIHCGTNTFRRLRQPEWWQLKTTSDAGQNAP